MSFIDHEVRRLKYLLKQAHKTIGKQGDTIHHLRCELAEVRTLNSKIDRGELRRLEYLHPIALDVIRGLREKLDAIEAGTPEQC